jgi:hypothetical protein
LPTLLDDVRDQKNNCTQDSANQTNCKLKKLELKMGDIEVRTTEGLNAIVWEDKRMFTC